MPDDLPYDDAAMDRLLQGALAAERPRLPAAFDARLLRRVRPRRLTPAGRVVMALYGVLAAVATVWLMRGLPPLAIAEAAVIGVPVAAASAFYGRLAPGRRDR